MPQPSVPSFGHLGFHVGGATRGRPALAPETKRAPDASVKSKYVLIYIDQVLEDTELRVDEVDV